MDSAIEIRIRSWRLHLWPMQLLLLLFQLPWPTQATERIIYWNASNPIFQPTGDNFLPVQLKDRLLFVCPTDGSEFYQIYWTTSADQYHRCSGGRRLFSCRLMNNYLLGVRLYTADPTTPVFSEPVYFYTPSTGDPLGMDQNEGGACLVRNMRLKVALVERLDDGAAASPQPVSGNWPTSQLASANNGRLLLASRPKPDNDRRRYQQQLNLITGSSAAAASATLVLCVSMLACALLRGQLS